MGDDEIVDAEVVYEVADDSAQLNLTQAEARVTMRPTGRECWLRLFSTTDSVLRRSKHQDHGVRAAYAHPANPHVLSLDLGENGHFQLSALAWRVNARNPRPGRTAIGSRETGQAVAVVRVDSIDVLTEFPPALPGKPRLWQQMTNPGELVHPGDNPDNWRSNVPYASVNQYETFGDPTRPPGTPIADDPRGRGIDGWKTLGTLGKLE